MENFAAFLIYVFVTTFTPGPNNILSMTNAARDGYRKTLRFLLGVVSGFTVIMLLSGLLNMVLVSLLPRIKVWLNVAGAVYMIYLAVHIMLSRPAAAENGKSSLNTFMTGFSMQFLNLKCILFGITVYSTFIVQSFQNPFIIALFAPLLAVIVFIAVSAWAVGGALFQNIFKKYWRWFNLVMGLLLIYTAVTSLIHAL